MNHLQAIRAQLREIGRCALVGTLVGLLATQAYALGGVTLTQKSLAQPETASFPGITGPLAINSQPATNLSLATSDTTTSNATTSSAITHDPQAIPDDPAYESASATAPPMLHLMLDQPLPGAQQSMQSAPAPKQKVVQRPGMLILGIAGIPLIAFGAWVYSIPTNSAKGNTLKGEYGSIFLIPGAAMSAIGFYLAFHHKKTN